MVRHLFEIRFVAGKGFGLFTKERVKKGSFIGLYAGEILSSAQANERWTTQRQSGSGADNYILVLQERMGDGSILKTIIDPATKGNLGRFLSELYWYFCCYSKTYLIDHACPPANNCTIFSIRSTGHFLPRAAIFANRDLPIDEELTFDYGAAGGEEVEKTAFFPSENLKPCLCGSSW